MPEIISSPDDLCNATGPEADKDVLTIDTVISCGHLKAAYSMILHSPSTHAPKTGIQYHKVEVYHHVIRLCNAAIMDFKSPETESCQAGKQEGGRGEGKSGSAGRERERGRD